jgi:hypothetical protein
MICSSLNRLRFIVRPPLGSDSTQIWRSFRGSGHDEPLVQCQFRKGSIDYEDDCVTGWGATEELAELPTPSFRLSGMSGGAGPGPT